MGREAMRVFTMGELFDGARFELKKPINMAPQFVTSHAVVMGNTFGAGAEEGSERYDFGASFISGDGTLALISKMDTMGVLKAVNDQAVFVNYHQKVMPELAFGAQLDYYLKRQMSILHFTTRYATAQWVATAKVASDKSVMVNYMHQVNDSFAMATQVDYKQKNRDSKFKVGYEYNLQSGRFRGEVNSAGQVGMSVQESLIFGITLTLSGYIDHKKRDYKFGIGLSIGS